MLRVVPATESSIAEAVERLRQGKLVAFPTETVYGLGARIWDREAVRRVFAAKARPDGHPLIAHVLGEEDARRVASVWPEAASKIARGFWPGPITVVVPKADAVPDEVTGGLDSVAVRAPAHPVARALLAALGEPIVAPSANRHQAISPTLAEHVGASLGSDLDLLVLDGGPCAHGIESTVLDVRVHPARILRPGPIVLDAIRAVGVNAEVADASVDAGARASPGMSPRHYAPRAIVQLATTKDERDRFVGDGAIALDLGDDPATAEHELYAKLYALDESKAERIAVLLPPDTEAWRAVRDRLKRAATR